MFEVQLKMNKQTVEQVVSDIYILQVDAHRIHQQLKREAIEREMTATISCPLSTSIKLSLSSQEDANVRRIHYSLIKP